MEDTEEVRVAEATDSHSPPDLTTPGPGAPAIAVKNLVKQFGPQSVLADISFEIGRGEMLVVLGPSGSGKTTLLRLISGLAQPDSGDIIFQGKRINDLPPQGRNLGVVFQDNALFRQMTVEQNVAFGLKVRKAPGVEIRRTVDEMIEMVHLQDHRSKYPSQLSGGQRQRVGLARALAARPGALLFDEPFSALDAMTRTELRREVRQLLRAMDVAALFITHDQEEALELGDRIAILNNGRVAQIGTPFDVYNHPCDEFVATFLGAANVLLGRWGAGKVRVGTTELKSPADHPALLESQAVKVVFRPEDVVLNFEAQLLDTPFFLGRGIVEDLSYVGPSERLIVRLMLWSGANKAATGTINEARRVRDWPGSEGFPITVTRSKWDSTEMELSMGDPVVVGLKDYRIMPHYPMKSESQGKVFYI
jgi:sulfate transport system ATP-binding protein